MRASAVTLMPPFHRTGHIATLKVMVSLRSTKTWGPNKQTSNAVEYPKVCGIELLKRLVRSFVYFPDIRVSIRRLVRSFGSHLVAILCSKVGVFAVVTRVEADLSPNKEVVQTKSTELERDMPAIIYRTLVDEGSTSSSECKPPFLFTHQHRSHRVA